MDIASVCELIGREGRTFAGAVTELMESCDTEIDERLRALELVRRRAEAEIAATIAVADTRQVYAADGHRGMAGYLRATCNWSNPEVGAHLVAPDT